MENGQTTIYIGNHYEQSGAVTTTYYYAGGTRIAMRQGSAANYRRRPRRGFRADTPPGTAA